MLETRGEMYSLAIIFTTAPIIAVAARFYTRLKFKLPLLWDDWLTLIALFFTVFLGVDMIVATAIGHLGEHTHVGPEGPVFDSYLIHFSETLFVNMVIQLLSVGPTKLSVLMFYRRIFSMSGRWFDYLSWLLIATVIGWMISFFFANLFQCVPVSLSWVAMGNGPRCIDETSMYLAQAYSDVVTDVLILSLPVPCIWKLQMSIRTKVAVTGLFFLGGLTVVASGAKMVVQYFVAAKLAENPDLTYYLSPIMYWPVIESGLGLTAACLLTIRPLFKELSLERLLDSFRRTFTLRPTTASSAWEQTGNLKGDADSASNSSRKGLNNMYNAKLETSVETVPLSEVRVVYNDVGIRVQKNFKRDDESL